MNDNMLDKIDIYNIEYTDGENLIGTITAKSVSNSEERYATTVYVNPNNNDFYTRILNTLMFGDSVDNRTVAIDYRLLNEDSIRALGEAYSLGVINGIRITPQDATLTKEVYDLLNRQEFRKFLISVDNIDSNIDLNRTYLDVREQRGIVAIEKTEYTRDNCNGRSTHVSNNNIHITRELSKEELEYVAQLLKNKKYNNIIVDFYEPSYYVKLITMLDDITIPSNVTIRFLANPLYDEATIYEDLEKITNNPIQIFYNSCNDLNAYYREGACNEATWYYSDIEASGKTDIKTYRQMLQMIDSITKHMEDKKFTPLEKLAYVYEYFKGNYRYNDNYTNEAHCNNADLDKIFSKKEMVCEGFSNLFSAILRRSGLLCFTYGTNNHQKNIIRITDPKYKVDNIALIDPTWEIDRTNHTGNKNSFKYFLLDLKNDLYADRPEVINIPTSFYIDETTYQNNIQNSNPVYATDPMGYGIRMLELMGLTSGDRVFNEESERRNFYRDALQNSKLSEVIPAEKIAEAVTEVRNQEGKYGYNGVDLMVKDYQNILADTEDRGNIQITPSISTLDNRIIGVNEYQAATDSQFTIVPPQNKTLSHPRRRGENETKEEYYKYLNKFYFDMFNGDELVENPQNNEATNEQATESTNESVNEQVNEQNATHQEEQQTLDKETIDNIISDVLENQPSQQPTPSVDNNNIPHPENTTKTNNYNYTGMTEEEIRQSRIKIEKAKYDDLYSRDQSDFIKGTYILKPRNKYSNETQEAYNKYVNDYMNYYFSTEQTNTYIHGTNILKPRDRGVYESDEDYIKYLAQYCNNNFGTAPTKTTKNNTDTSEKVTLYVTEDMNNFYVRKYAVTRYQLTSATSEPVRIGGALCYQISQEDAQKLINNSKNNLTPYQLEFVRTSYEQSTNENSKTYKKAS